MIGGRAARFKGAERGSHAVGRRRKTEMRRNRPVVAVGPDSATESRDAGRRRLGRSWESLWESNVGFWPERRIRRGLDIAPELGRRHWGSRHRQAHSDS